VIPTLRRKENFKFKASLVYILRPSQKTKQNKDSFFVGGGTGVWIQGLTLARQVFLVLFEPLHQPQTKDSCGLVHLLIY
jgi:hypothetical protein